MKHIPLLTALASFALTGLSPALSPGDIAFVGFNSDGNDNLAFVALADVPSGQSIFFEDNEWNGTGWNDTNENAFIWTATSNVAAGTIITLDAVNTATPSASTGSIEFGPTATHGNNRGIGNGDEIIYAYQGSRATPTFISAVTNGTGGFAGANGVLTGTGLTVGTTALDLNALDDDGDIYAWIGNRSGYASWAAVGAAINASPVGANWNFQDASGDQSADGTAPDVPFSGTAFSLNAVNVLTLSVTPSAFLESATNPAATGTVSRSITVASSLAVSLASADTTEVTVPATVTIPANQPSVTFNVTAVNDGLDDGDISVNLNATATGATAANFSVTVQDDDAPPPPALQTGDIAFTAFNADRDAIAFVALDAIPGGEIIFITDNEWNGSTIGAGGSFNTGEGQMQWTAPAGGVAAGTVVVIDQYDTATPTSSIGTVIQSGDTGISATADTLYAFQGTSATQPLVFLAAIANHAADSISNTGLTSGSTVVYLTSSTDYAGYTGPRSGQASFADYLPLIGNVGTNWAIDVGGDGSAVIPDGTAFTTGALAATVGISATASVVEGDSGDALLTFTVTRSNATTAFDVNYNSANGTATEPGDYAATSGTLHFTTGGALSENVSVTVHGDAEHEADETLTVMLSGIVNQSGTTTLGTASGTGTILNDDPVGPAFATQPGSTFVVTGGSTTLAATASGDPAPTYQWYIGNSGDTGNPIGGATSASYLTPALSTTTRYWVRATNPAGSVDSATATVTVVSGPTSIDLSTYVRLGRYGLPEGTRDPLPAGTPSHNLLCQEASGVAYNWDTETLFVIGDGGRSVTQVSKNGVLIDTMTLALGSSPQGTDFYDPEGITYIGGNQFVFSEERDRQLVKFTYAAGTTLSRAGAQTVKIGTSIGNVGTEGLSYDPLTSGFICMKEINPLGIFQTGVDFNAGTATNGSPTTVNSINLFDPALLGTSDTADVFALSNLPSMTGQAQQENLLVISQEAARIVNINRSGSIHSQLQIVADVGSSLSVAEQQHEGLVMDRAGYIYVVNENGGGDINHPELWVYGPATAPNSAPTAVIINNPVLSIGENTSTIVPIKVGDLIPTDDGQGVNVYSLGGADAASFEISNSSLYLKAGTVLDYETKTSYSVTVSIDDASVGTTPDASVNFTLNVTDVVNETPEAPTLFISEVHSTGNGNGSYNADWIEITNAGTLPLDISGWQINDNSDGVGTGKLPLRGVTSIPAGKSAIFIEGVADASTDAALIASFSTAWFGTATLPAGFIIGTYGGTGIGLGSGGDSVNIYNASDTLMTGVSFGSATVGLTFDNQAGIGSDTAPLPVISLKSSAGVNGAFVSAGGTETGSPGVTGHLIITEVCAWGNDTAVAADWFEVKNGSGVTVNLAGWEMDDSSESPVAAVALQGIASIAPGETVIFIETATPLTTIPAFLNHWFAANPPSGLQVGSYAGSGVGLSAGSGDAVNLYDATGFRQASASFAASPTSPLATFDNAAGTTFAAISQRSIPGVNGGFVAKNGAGQVGSPGAIANNGPLNFTLWLDVNGYTSAGFNADSNNNGVRDGVEFFFNADLSKNADFGNLPKLTTVGGDRLLTFTTLSGAAGVTGALQCSDDLGETDAWMQALPNVDYEAVSSVTAAGETTTTIRLLGEAANQFWRYMVTGN